MKFTLSFSLLLAFGVNAEEVTPTAKVVTLLQGMLEHGKGAKREEQVVFQNKEKFCQDNSADKKRAVKKEQHTIDSLAAQINKDGADVSRLANQVSALNMDESTMRGDIKALTAVRSIDYTDYEKTHNDYTQAIDAVSRAMAAMKQETHDRKQGESFAQLSSLQKVSLIPASAKKTITAFVQTVDADADPEASAFVSFAAPEANAFEFQSTGVIDMLESLQSKFTEELTSLEKEEASSKQAFALYSQDLTAQVAQAQKDQGRTSVLKATTLKSKASETSDRNAEVALEKVDTKFLTDLKTTCALDARDFAARQKLRAGELVAIEKAIEILSGDAVTGMAAKHLPSFLQTKKTSSFSQLRFTASSQVQGRVSQFLQERAQKFNSAVLAAVAQHAAADPFVKVKKMIKDLVIRLMEEANEESEHKGWCDTEQSTNKKTRQEKTGAVQLLNANIDQLVASIAKLSEEVTDLSAAVSALSTAMASATAIRSAEKAENTEAVSDSQTAQAAVAQATIVLKEFYAEAAEAVSFAQTGAPYTGMAAENGGVIGMLEVIESDFARLESETNAAEATSQKTYDTFMTDSKVDKASKDEAIKGKEAKNQDLTQELSEKRSDLEGTQKELDAALAYNNKLKPSCVDASVSYEDRVARRKEEVESLQDALRVMNGEDIA